MKDAQQIAGFLSARIGRIYERPLMYGGTAAGVDLILHSYHELWAMIHGRDEEYREISDAIHAAEGCGSADFAFHYRRAAPHAPEEEVARYSVEQWSKLSDRLGLFDQGSIRLTPPARRSGGRRGRGCG